MEKGLTCPECGSIDTRKFRVSSEKENWGSAGITLYGFRIVKNIPRRKNRRPEFPVFMVGICILVGFSLSVFSIVRVIQVNGVTFSSIAAILGILAILGWFFGSGAIGCIKEYEKKRFWWDQAWKCERCGHQWIPKDTTQHAVEQKPNIGDNITMSVESSTKTVHPQKELVNEDIHIESIEIQTEALQISKRFNEVLELMNRGRSDHNKFTRTRLAQLLKLEKTSDLEDIFEGKTDPSFDLIHLFCETFGVNEDWLTEGKNAPFDYSEYDYPSRMRLHWCFDRIKELAPQKVYFIRDNSEDGHFVILAKIQEWKYKILHRNWKISSKVGNTGASVILSFYDLIKKIDNSFFPPFDCGGTTVNPEDLSSLATGKIFPGQLLYPDWKTEDYWWIRFIDIHYKNNDVEYYEKEHGSAFIEAQRIVRALLREKGHKDHNEDHPLEDS